MTGHGGTWSSGHWRTATVGCILLVAAAAAGNPGAHESVAEAPDRTARERGFGRGPRWTRVGLAMLRAPFRPFVEPRTYRELLFLLTAAPLSAAWFGLLLAGWLATGLLAVTPLLVTVLVGFRALTWLAASAEATIARNLLGVEVEVPRPAFGRRGYWGRIRGVAGDARLWREQAYLFLRMLAGGAQAIAIASAFGASVWMIVTPITYRWTNETVGSWHVETLSDAWPFLPAGIAGVVLSAWLVRPFAAVWRSLAPLLLGVRADDVGDAGPEVSIPAALRRALPFHAAFFVVLNAALTLVWALTTRAYFWPMWTLLPLGLVLAVHWWTVLSQSRRPPARVFRTAALAIHAGASSALSLFLVAVWAVTSLGYFWPVWPMLALATVAGAHAAILLATAGNRAALSRRIDVLTATRAGAVDASEAELRRIERDLHDGAQARLVALGMSLGMAEQKLATDPDAARQLLAEARAGAGEALKELRDLARGIHPPVLADRGLEAALAALAARSPLPVDVSVELDVRPPEPVETAVYFVAAEALANAAKHAGASRVEIRVGRAGEALTVEVDDDGRGGADPGGRA